MNEIKNAVIESTFLGKEGHGILSSMLTLDYGGSCQGFGGYGFDKPIKDDQDNFLRREGTAYGCEFINRILETLDVESWEKLKGTHLRVVTKGDFFNSKIQGIGHIIKDKWFYPEKDLSYFFPSEEKESEAS